MTLQELLDYTRKHVLRDVQQPYLFPDELVIAYLDEGNKKVATRTHHFVTATRELSLDAGENVYPLDEDIVYVYSVRLDGYHGWLTLSTEDWTKDDGTVSRPLRYTLDRETQTVRFHAIPDQAYTALLRCAVLPATLSEDALSADVEIQDRFRLTPADWAAYRCFGNDDVDGRNDQAAANALARFNMAVGENKRDEYRLKFGHNARARGMRVK